MKNYLIIHHDDDHAPGHENLDLSKIAVMLGSGGHKGACGFQVTLNEMREILEHE